MRDAFVRALMREAAADPRLTLITGDLGFGVLKPFWETYPDQFVNAGIAEQGMTGLAAGLARTGRTVLTILSATFPPCAASSRSATTAPTMTRTSKLSAWAAGLCTAAWA